jgi:hypothetical protein
MEEGDEEEPCVLARLDIASVEHGGKSVYSRAFLHPSLRVRVVPTKRAPNHATIPKSFIKQVNERMQNAKIKDEYSIPLKPFVSKDTPEGKLSPTDKEWSGFANKYFMDVCFASLGWINIVHEAKFAVVPHVVEGSIFSKRKSLYPLSLQGYEEEEEEYLDEDTIHRRLQDAARQGRHQQSKYDDHGDYGSNVSAGFEEDDEWY